MRIGDIISGLAFFTSIMAALGYHFTVNYLSFFVPISAMNIDSSPAMALNGLNFLFSMHGVWISGVLLGLGTLFLFRFSFRFYEYLIHVKKVAIIATLILIIPIFESVKSSALERAKNDLYRETTSLFQVRCILVSDERLGEIVGRMLSHNWPTFLLYQSDEYLVLFVEPSLRIEGAFPDAHIISNDAISFIETVNPVRTGFIAGYAGRTCR